MENELSGGMLAVILHEIGFRRAALAQVNRIIADCPYQHQYSAAHQQADELRADIQILELASRRLGHEE